MWTRAVGAVWRFGVLICTENAVCVTGPSRQLQVRKPLAVSCCARWDLTGCCLYTFHFKDDALAHRGCSHAVLNDDTERPAWLEALARRHLEGTLHVARG